ncbi:phosphatase PAP2 family protein [Veillonella denticariosi]|uniref:phosphatase PAP2 family protein n=1 Tax=Veillonella denticariosi TaxID=419208 RepID=UPI0024924212|nr:phosphatase PAP2 family protein [Veillonella denticariosi]
MNYELFQTINNLAGHYYLLDTTMIFIVKYIAEFFAVLILCLLCLGIYYKDKIIVRNVLHTIIFLGIALSAHAIIGFLSQEPRPFVSHTVTLLVPHTPDSSFPSTHAMGMTAIGLSVYSVYKGLGTTLLSGTIITGIAKVFVGHHYPMDIIMGIIITYILYKIYQTYISSYIDEILDYPKHSIIRILISTKQTLSIIKQSQQPLSKQSTIKR